MAKIKHKEPKRVTKKPLEQKANLDKLHLYFTIVNKGNSDSVIKLMENIGCSLSYVHNGEGTANPAVKKLLGIMDPSKEVVVSIVKEKLLPEINKQLEAFFVASKKNSGIGFSVRLTSVMGVKTYKFLTQTM